MLELITENAVVVLGIMGFMSFIISVIVEMTKELPVIIKMPTKAYVLIISIICCIAAVLIYAALKSIVVEWYFIVLAIFAAFIIGYLSMYGWDTLNELYKRYKK